MEIFGLVLTWGHLLMALLAVIAYDAIMTLVHNDVSTAWFRRQNFPIRMMVFGVVIAILVIARIDPILSLWLFVAFVLVVVGFALWMYFGQPRRPTVPPAQPPAAQP